MATFNVNLQADREFIEDHEEVANHLKQTELRRLAYQSQADSDQTLRDSIGDRVRRGLVRYKSALDSVLEQQITDIEIEKDSNGNIIKIYTNDEAKTFRNS